MIAVDTCSMIAFLQGNDGEDVVMIQSIITMRELVLPAPVLSELLSDHMLDERLVTTLQALPSLTIIEGFWERVGFLRASILQHKKKARLADALIAQNCLDHDVPLITRDNDFRHFAQYASLSLLPTQEGG